MFSALHTRESSAVFILSSVLLSIFTEVIFLKINLVRRLTESAIMLAVSTLLSMITLVRMPFGGSLTPVSMLPMFIIAYRYGVGWGFFTGVTSGLLQMFLGMDSLSYATNWVAAVSIILFDYLIAFGATGMAGLFRKSFKSRWLGFSLGITLGCMVRFLCHFLTGVTVWKAYATSMPVGLYSLLYNGAYMLPETVMTVVVGVILTSFVDFTSPTLRKVNRK